MITAGYLCFFSENTMAKKSFVQKTQRTIVGAGNRAPLVYKKSRSGLQRPLRLQPPKPPSKQS